MGKKKRRSWRKKRVPPVVQGPGPFAESPQETASRVDSVRQQIHDSMTRRLGHHEEAVRKYQESHTHEELIADADPFGGEPVLRRVPNPGAPPPPEIGRKLKAYFDDLFRDTDPFGAATPGPPSAAESLVPRVISGPPRPPGYNPFQ